MIHPPRFFVPLGTTDRLLNSGHRFVAGCDHRPREDHAMYRPGWGEGMLETMLDEPRDTPWNKWGCGVAFPALLTLVGGRVMFIQQFTIPGRRLQRLQLTGSDAWWVGLAILGLAAWFHFHFFWTHHPRLAPYAELGKIAGLLTFIGGLAWAAFAQFRLV